MTSKKFGTALILIGAVLIFSALFLLHSNKEESEIAGASSAEIVSIIENKEYTPATKDEPAAKVDGKLYIGCIEIPKLGIKLPVCSDWSYEQLKSTPCRQFGTAKENNLVIAAHNYESHFGRISKLSPGDEVIFLDLEGNTIRYSAESLEEISPTDVEKIQKSGFDLVLYTCNFSGHARKAVFCRRK